MTASPTSAPTLLDRGRQRPYLAALLLFTLLTIVAAWPALMRLDAVLIGSDPDTMINPWADWWTRQNLLNPSRSFWYTDFIFYPLGADLTFHSFSHLNTFVSLLLRPLLGPIAAYNLVILLNVALTGVAMFHLAFDQTRSFTAGVLAGIVFAFNSYNQYQGAHPVLISLWCLPWLTLFFLRAVKTNELKWALLTGLMIGLAALASTLLLTLAAILLAFLVFYTLVTAAYPRPSLRLLAVSGAVGALFVLPVNLPLLRAAVLEANDTFIQDPAASIVTDLIAVVVPHWYYWLPRGMYIGLAPFYLGVVAWGQRRRQAWPWLLLALTAFLMAIGPQPRIGALKFDITLPWSYLITPLLRNPHRMMNLFALGLALLAAQGWVGVAQLLNRPALRPVAGLLFALLIFGEYTAAPFPLTPLTVSDFYTGYLADVPAGVALATVPSGRQEAKRHLFFQTIHGHPITAGVVSRAEENRAFIANNAILRALDVDSPPQPIPANLDQPLAELAAAGVGLLLFDKIQMDTAAWTAQMPGAPVYEDDQVVVYATR